MTLNINRCTRRKALGWGLAAALPLTTSLAACDRAPTMEKLTLAHAHQPAFGLLYVADREGLFKAEGLEVVFQRYNTGRDALNAVLEGKADVGTPFDTPVVLGILQQKPLQILCTLSLLTANNVVLARKDRGIRSTGDLRGRRVAIVPNTSGEYILSRQLVATGVSTDSIVRVEMQPPEAVQALVKGDVDAAALWAPHTDLVQQQLGADAVATLTASGYVEASTLTTLDSVLTQRRSAIDKLLRAVLKAETLAQREPAQGLKQVLAALDDLPPELVTKRWQALQPQVRLDNQLHTSMNNQALWFAEKLELPFVDVRPYLSDATLRSLKPQAVTLRALL